MSASVSSDCQNPGKEYAIGEVVEAGDFKRCAAMAYKALEHDKDCGQPKVRDEGRAHTVCSVAMGEGVSLPACHTHLDCLLMQYWGCGLVTAPALALACMKLCRVAWV